MESSALRGSWGRTYSIQHNEISKEVALNTGHREHKEHVFKIKIKLLHSAVNVSHKKNSKLQYLCHSL